MTVDNIRKGRPWTPEEDEQLRGLIKIGSTARQIANILGRNRNSVIGRSYRIHAWFKKGRLPREHNDISSTPESEQPTQPNSSSLTKPATQKTVSKKVTGLGLRLRGW